MSTFDMLTCYNNEEFFIQNYFFTVNPFKGKSLIDLTPKQLNFLHQIQSKTFVADIITERQIGVSTMFAAHALWLATFKNNVNIIMMARTRKEAKAIRNMIKVGYENLPGFLQEKRTVDNKFSMEFQNGSRIYFMNSDPYNLYGAMSSYIFCDSFEYYTDEHQKGLYRHSDLFHHRFVQIAML